MVGDFGWEHEGTECQVDTVKLEDYILQFRIKEVFSPKTAPHL